MITGIDLDIFFLVLNTAPQHTHTLPPPRHHQCHYHLEVEGSACEDLFSPGNAHKVVCLYHMAHPIKVIDMHGLFPHKMYLIF